ncbi:D-alanyl-D-alanine carboxypeptidase [Streptomyces spinoverrucosus]|uniref:D-alanyl-D-alanine carboxypeptidase n=1 Tax=Streptomyces spinoverrucosus TaxID=284043 RepID=UPI0018C3729B|nr:D-alanyl-D-alanine carboxypeptidase [Streptomyces spinoverrucosus]MBG0854533.1 D-alanyl-D-alanine carboxypeptidase [Streptomyces spinoverrucosus]
MEEASVAGESPDSSKQRESSAEPTSGSAGPVPEARNGAATARDPRLAVARESGDGRSVDTATRVFSVKGPSEEEPEGAAGEAASEAPAGREERDGAEDGAGADAAGDERLRAAVAAWVTSADGKAGGKADEGAEGSAEEGADAAGVDAKGATEEDADEEGADAGETPVGEEDSADVDTPARQGESNEEGPNSGSTEHESESAGEPDAQGKGAGGTDAPGDRAAAAADAKSTSDATEDKNAPADQPDAQDGPEAVQVGQDRKDGRTGAEAEADTADESDAGGENDAAAGKADGSTDTAADDTQDGEGGTDETPSDAKNDTERDARVDAEDAPKRDAQDDTENDPKSDARVGAERNAQDDTERDAQVLAQDDTERDAQVHAQDDTERDAQDDAKSNARVHAQDDTERDAQGHAQSDARVGAERDAQDDTERDAQDDARVDAQDEPKNDAKSEPQDAPKSDPDAQSGVGGDAPEADAPPVDQPTAVFRAVKSVKPAVDQPTTMLKLGDAKKPAPAPESDAERTSKFVALKPLDDPSTRKPPRAAEATTALPKVPADKPKAPPADATTALPKVPADQTASVPQVGPERTTQQPLPPKPPLDLLAELTNTPPPPETPLRTAVRRVKIWTPLVILLAIVFAIVQAVRPLPTPALELTAEESYTFEGDKASLPWPSEGQGAMDVTGIGTMGSFGEQKPVAIGSVAKAMTAYIILKEHPLKPGEEGPQIEVDATAEKEGGYDQQGNESTLNTVKAGDKLTERQAISAIMIPSANNIARLVARWDAGSEEAFVKKMNDTAKELGMTNTTYTDPSGLEGTTVSTAEDQVKLGNELVRIPALVEITKLPKWTDPSGQEWRNWNTLVPYNGAIGIKTGTTTTAGGNLLFAATKEVGGETVTVVGAILGQHTAPIIDTVNAVSETAMLGAQEALTSAKIMKKGDVVGYVDDRLGGRTPVVVTQDVTAVGWAGHKVKLSFASDAVPHTAKAGTKVGTLTVGDGSGGAVEVPVALQSDLDEPGFTDKLTRVG